MTAQRLNFNKHRTLTSMPNMANTLNGWEFPLTLIKVIQGQDEGDLTTQEETIDFMGVWQPLRDEQLQSKPEGQRSWSWIWIHAKAGSLNLKTADKVKFQGRRYKVMNLKDYSLNGFIEYELCEDFQ